MALLPFCNAITAVDMINALRAKHNAPPVVYNDTLELGADQWAKHLVSIKALVHSGPGHGENLGAVTYSSSTAWQTVVNAWYAEGENYDYSNPGFTSTTAHFTQLVWIDTTDIGLGLELDTATNNLYVVMWFYPPGNYQGEFVANVLPPPPVAKKSPTHPLQYPPKSPPPLINTHPPSPPLPELHYTCMCSC